MKNDVPPLIARFERRYKRFFADVTLDDGSTLTAHCPNTGSLTGCKVEGARVLLRDSNNPKRKLRYTWQAIEIDGTWVNVDTLLPNRVVREAIELGRVPALVGYADLRTEVAYGDRSRIDVLLTDAEKPDCYIEVKSTTLVDGELAMFPDAVTERGRKHLGELVKMVQAGHRAVQLFLVSRGDVTRFQPADHIDPAYGQALREAAIAGVEVLAYTALVNLEETTLGNAIPVEL
ncbi:MAG: sugar fermentation stimulation protein A [Planctomycetota bacterium]|jgi:sugar fermentation stimulation protein A